MKSEACRQQILLLNNFGNTGIGLFGRSLASNLLARGTEVILSETQTNPLSFVRQFVAILRTRRILVANVGLTSWGTSPARNLLGFLSLSLRAELGRPTVLLLHNLIEVVDTKGTGYAIGPVAARFAHWAVVGTRKAAICVFSREIANALSDSYRITVSRCAPLPCDSPLGSTIPPADPPAIVCFGFLSPYKGVDLFLQAAKKINAPCRLLIVGQVHSLLHKDSAYQVYVQHIHDLAKQVNAEFLGFVPDTDLMGILKRCQVGVLPYTSTTGTSASFTQLATAGVPVIATDLPEFQFLAQEGAGIVLVEPDPSVIAANIRRLLLDRGLRLELSAKQVSYAAKHSWDELCNWIEDRGKQFLPRGTAHKISNIA